MVFLLQAAPKTHTSAFAHKDIKKEEYSQFSSNHTARKLGEVSCCFLVIV